MVVGDTVRGHDGAWSDLISRETHSLGGGLVASGKWPRGSRPDPYDERTPLTGTAPSGKEWSSTVKHPLCKLLRRQAESRKVAPHEAEGLASTEWSWA